MHSHQFARINLKNNQYLLDTEDTIVNADSNKYSTKSRNIVLKSITTTRSR